MSAPRPSQHYRDIIDSLVETCQVGQGQVGAQRARAGTWNRNATPTRLPFEHKLNELFSSLPAESREAIAAALAREFEAGVFETLKVLAQHEVDELIESHEGSAHEDFVGRLGGWEWPSS